MWLAGKVAYGRRCQYSGQYWGQYWGQIWGQHRGLTVYHQRCAYGPLQSVQRPMFALVSLNAASRDVGQR